MVRISEGIGRRKSKVVNLHKLSEAILVAKMACYKAEREGRNVTESDLSEAHELLKESGLTKKEEK